MLLDRADESIALAANKARTTGDALLARAVSEATILAASIRLQMHQEIDDVIGEVQNQSNLAYYRLATIVDGFEDAQTRAYHARDATLIDLAMIAGTVPFAKDLTFIERIDGLAQFASDKQERKLIVAATGMKPGMADVRTTLTLNIGGKTVAFREQPLGENQRQLILSSGELDTFFEPDRINVVPAQLTLTTERARRIGRPRVATATAPFYISFFPPKAGTLTVESRHTTYKWVDLGEMLFDVARSDDCGLGKCNRNPPVYVKVCRVPGGDREAAGNQRIVGTPRPYCAPQWGPNSCAYPGGWFSVSAVNIEDQGTKGTLTIKHWTEPNDYGIYCTVQEFRAGDTATDTQSVELYYDRNLEFLVPPNTTYWRITGTLLTRQQIDVLQNQPSKELNFVGAYDEGNGTKRVVYELEKPQG